MNAIPTLIDPPTLAKLLRVSVTTLKRWRRQQPPPLAFVRVGRQAFYRADDVLEFLERQKNAL